MEESNFKKAFKELLLVSKKSEEKDGILAKCIKELVEIVQEIEMDANITDNKVPDKKNNKRYDSNNLLFEDFFISSLTSFPNNTDVVKEHQLADNGDTIKIGANFNDKNGDISLYVKLYNPQTFVEQEVKEYLIKLFNDEPKTRISLPLELVGYVIVELLQCHGISFDELGEGIISVPLELDNITSKIWVSDDGKFISISRKFEEETVGDLGAKYGF